MNKLYNAGIIGTGSSIPDKILTNSDLEQIVDTTDEWIVSRTGIKERRIADSKVATSDLATEAAKKALEDANLKASDLDMILVATVTPDMHFPSTACLVQSNLGIEGCPAFDIEAACSGALYGLITASQFISTGLYKNILVIGAECLSKIVNWQDRNTCVLFGDGAGAFIVSRVDKGYGLLAHSMGADGNGSKLLKVEAGGSKRPASLETVEKGLHYLQMEGSEVFKFAVKIMAKASEEVIAKAKLSLDDIDFLIPHQANIRIIDASRRRLKLSKEKVYMNLMHYGNMSAASVPVALDEASRAGKIQKGDNIILVAFGGGLTWASTLLKWGK